MTPVSSSVCLLCGAPLKSRRPHARHCSGACRAEASRLRAILRGARSSPLTIRRRPPQGRPKAHKGAAGHMSKRHKRGRSKGWKGDPRPLGKWTICEASASRPILRMSSLGPKPRRRVRLIKRLKPLVEDTRTVSDEGARRRRPATRSSWRPSSGLPTTRACLSRGREASRRPTERSSGSSRPRSPPLPTAQPHWEAEPSEVPVLRHRTTLSQSRRGTKLRRPAQ
jgi:hypothetical protein